MVGNLHAIEILIFFQVIEDREVDIIVIKESKLFTLNRDFSSKAHFGQINLVS